MDASVLVIHKYTSGSAVLMHCHLNSDNLLRAITIHLQDSSLVQLHFLFYGHLFAGQMQKLNQILLVTFSRQEKKLWR